HLARKPGMVRLLHLVIIVEPADQAEARRHQQARPDVRVGEVHPQQNRDRQRNQDEEAAHGRRAALGEVALRPVLANRLPLPLGSAQPTDELRAEQKPDQERGARRRAGTEADVADEVEEAGKVQLVGDHVEHATPPDARSTSLASPTEFEAFTSTASPGRIIRISASVASSTLDTRSKEMLPTICSASGRISSPIRIRRSTCASRTAGASPA